jgi:hypothetical protein
LKRRRKLFQLLRHILDPLVARARVYEFSFAGGSKTATAISIVNEVSWGKANIYSGGNVGYQGIPDGY